MERGKNNQLMQWPRGSGMKLTSFLVITVLASSNLTTNVNGSMAIDDLNLREQYSPRPTSAERSYHPSRVSPRTNQVLSERFNDAKIPLKGQHHFKKFLQELGISIPKNRRLAVTKFFNTLNLYTIGKLEIHRCDYQLLEEFKLLAEAAWDASNNIKFIFPETIFGISIDDSATETFLDAIAVIIKAISKQKNLITKNPKTRNFIMNCATIYHAVSTGKLLQNKERINTRKAIDEITTELVHLWILDHDPQKEAIETLNLMIYDAELLNERLQEGLNWISKKTELSPRTISVREQINNALQHIETAKNSITPRMHKSPRAPRQ